MLFWNYFTFLILRGEQLNQMSGGVSDGKTILCLRHSQNKTLYLLTDYTFTKQCNTQMTHIGLFANWSHTMFPMTILVSRDRSMLRYLWEIGYFCIIHLHPKFQTTCAPRFLAHAGCKRDMSALGIRSSSGR